MKRIVIVTVVLTGILSIISINCKKNKVPVPTSIELVSGGGQSATIETILQGLIEVIVKDQNGDPYLGANVFSTTTDGYVAPVVLTNHEGKAVNTWLLGKTVGTQSLTIFAYETDGVTHLEGSPIIVNATATAIPVEQTTDLAITVYFDGTNNVVDDCQVALYDNIDDWYNITNAVDEGYTNSNGQITFTNLQPIIYYIDAYKASGSGYYNNNSDYMTDPLVEKTINYYDTYVEYIGKKDGSRRHKVTNIRKILNKVE